LARRALSKLPRTFAPLTREDLPKAGDILALDAEFVSLQTVPYFLTFTHTTHTIFIVFSSAWCHRGWEKVMNHNTRLPNLLAKSK
jgi:hypothetical protein